MSENLGNGTRGQPAAIPVPQHVLFIGGALIAASALLIAFAVLWIGARGGLAITEEEAIQAAIDQVEADGVMTLEGRDTVAEVEDGNWHVYFPFSAVPPIIWGDIDCSGEADGGDALPVLKHGADLDDGQGDGCPPVGSAIDPASICEDVNCANIPRGGEPHVIVNGDDGLIEDVYYSQ